MKLEDVTSETLNNTSCDERARNGAQWFDNFYPGWESDINLETLEIDHYLHCVCGQTIGYKQVLEELYRLYSYNWLSVASYLGFIGKEEQTEAWRKEIRRRFDEGDLSNLKWVEPEEE